MDFISCELEESDSEEWLILKSMPLTLSLQQTLLPPLVAEAVEQRW